MSNDNKAGYAKPPKHSQFKPGQSGNSKGRPKGVKNLQTIVQKEAYSKIAITENGKRHKVTKVEAVFKSMLAKGINGDTKAATIALRLLESYLPHGFDESGNSELLTDEELKILETHADFRELIEEARDARSES